MDIVSMAGLVPVVDLFAGGGGLGEGFAAWPEHHSPFFRTVLSIEKLASAARTLRLRAFFRSFPAGEVPDVYYRFVRGEPVDDAFLAFLDGRATLQSVHLPQVDVWCTALGERGFDQTELDRRIAEATQGRGDWVLIGGPPCQPFSIAGRTRQRSIAGYTIENDPRSFLYREYLSILARHGPAVFVMENVKGMLSAKLEGGPVLAKVLEDLSDPGRLYPAGDAPRFRYRIWPLAETFHQPDLFGVYPQEDYLIESERFGIPQKRHRVILLGIRDDIDVIPRPLREVADHVPVSAVLAGLPPLRSGIALTPESRRQWQEIVAAGAPPGGWNAAELHDVVDSPAQWRALLRSAVFQNWFAELDELGQRDVRDHIVETIDGLAIPHDDRGRGYIPGGLPPTVLRDWYHDPVLRGCLNHRTREHMPSDHFRYLFAAAFASVRGVSPRLRDFPSALLPEHRNVHQALSHNNFADRFRVQVGGLPATTVMSHIAKDGHYFIHPDPSQARSLTVREAARLQTFPDNYYFCGNRSEQYIQVGNAVPPLLAYQIAGIVAEVLRPFPAGQSNLAVCDA